MKIRLVIKEGFWGATSIWYVAETATSSGVAIVAKSDEIEPIGIGDSQQKYDQRENAAHQKLLQQLLSQGWEPIGTDDKGRVMSLKRTPQQSTSPHSNKQRTTAERLSELEQLRAQKVITEEEYKRKREEILRDF